MTTASGWKVPDALERLDLAWLTDVLHAAGRTDAKVVGVAMEPTEIAGAAGELGRIVLTYDDAGAPGPASVIAKFRGTSENQRAMDSALGTYDRERHFYAEIAATVPVASPACFFAGDGHRTPLLLEDLAGLHVPPVARPCGCAGILTYRAQSGAREKYNGKSFRE